jgi:hypothetical protein
MKLIVAGLLLCLVSVLGSSTTSRGYLVDAGCFQREERNVNPDYVNVPAGRDIDFEIRACLPRANKTNAFMVVLLSGEVVKLDAAGNSQAAKLVNAAGKPGTQRRFVVNITGTISNRIMYVDSIAAAK